MIGRDSKSRVVRPHCHVHEHAGEHTHTHTFAHVYTICSPQHTQHIKKGDFVELNGGQSWES